MFCFACCLRFILECHRSLGDCCDLLLWRVFKRMIRIQHRSSFVDRQMFPNWRCDLLKNWCNFLNIHTIGWSRSSSGNLLDGIEASSIFIQWLSTCWKVQRSFNITWYMVEFKWCSLAKVLFTSPKLTDSRMTKKCKS